MGDMTVTTPAPFADDACDAFEAGQTPYYRFECDMNSYAGGDGSASASAAGTGGRQLQRTAGAVTTVTGADSSTSARHVTMRHRCIVGYTRYAARILYSGLCSTDHWDDR